MTNIIDTKYGRIAEPSGPCKDDYELIEHFHQDGTTIVLQHGAMESYKDACRAFANRTRQHDNFRIIPITGSLRSCSLQTQLWHSDPNRYANPDGSLHCRGLAIDVWYPLVNQIIHSLLMNRGWHQARSDEPWHYSYHFSG